MTERKVTTGDELQPWMWPIEVDLLRRSTRDRRLILEYGSGGSTVDFLTRTQARVVSVESDPEWVAKLREHPLVAESGSRVDLRHVDIGPVGEHGTPVDPATSDRWPSYWHAGDDLDPDLVFVDGRFRVACALRAAICWGVPVVMHDFNRPYYQGLLKHYDLTERAARLVFLHCRDWGVSGLCRDLEQYALDAR